MSILELATPEVDSEFLSRQCKSAIAVVADGVRSEQRQDQRERGEEIAEPLDDEQWSALEAENRTLRQQVQFLESQRDRSRLALRGGKKYTRDLRLEKIDDIDRTMKDLVSRLDGIAMVTESALSASRGLATELDRRFDRFSETVSQVRRTVLPSDDEVPEIPADDAEIEEEPKLTLSMAKEKLRDLRNRIERETGAKPWENICMMAPIVQEALASASARGLSDVEDWLGLPAVMERYPDKKPEMDRQLEKFGEAMMAIYRRVERSGGHRSG